MKQLFNIIILIIIVLEISVVNGQENCTTVYTKMFNFEVPDSYEAIYLATGKNIPKDAGDYELCWMLENTHHCIVDFVLDATVALLPLQWGFCFPDVCHPSEIPDALQIYLDHILPIPTTLITSTIEIHCLEDLQRDFSAGPVITIVLVVIVFILVVSAFFLAYFKFPQSKSIEGSQYFAVKSQQKNHENDSSDSAEISDNSKINKEEIINQKKDEERLEDNNWDQLDLKNKDSPKKSFLIKLLLSFNIFKNWRKMHKPYPFPEFSHFSFFRIISMFWIILGETISIQEVTGYRNIVYVISEDGPTTKWPFQFIMGAEFAADTFFVISGFLVTFYTIHKLKKKEFSFWKYYIHRFFRLFPVLFFVLIIYNNLSLHLSNGPYYHLVKDGLKNTCNKYWYSTLFFFNNFYPKDYNDECMNWCWYLANDVQFYIIAPIFSVLYIINQWIGFSIVGVFGIISLALNFYLVDHYNINFTLLDEDQYNTYRNKIYTKPYTRILPYLVGVGFAMATFSWKKLQPNRSEILEIEEQEKLVDKPKAFEKKKRITKIHYALSNIIFLVAFATMAVVQFSPYDNFKNLGNNWNNAQNAVYIGLSKLLWGLAVGLILLIFVYFHDTPSAFKKFLFFKIWVPISRLTYSVYVSHPVVMLMVIFSSRILFDYDTTPIFYNSIANVGTCYLIGFILYFLVEQPFMNLEKLIMKRFLNWGKSRSD